MQADDAVAIANEFFSTLDNLKEEVKFLMGEIKVKDEEIDTIRARMQGRMQNILKHARQPSTANKENKTSSPASASTGTTIGPLNAKDEASMAHIAVEWTKIDQLNDEKTELASRLDRLVTRHRERGRDEWRKIAGDEAVEEFDAANPDWPSDGLAAAVAGSLAGTPGAMQHLNGLLSAGGSAGLMMTGGLGSFSATAGSFRTGISTAGLSPLAMDDKMMKKRKANADGSISGYFTNMGPPPVPGYVMAGGSGSTLPHGQGHVHAAAQLPSLHHSGQSAHPMSPGWAINQASQSGRGQYGHGQSNKRRVQSMDLDDSFVMTTEMAEGEADAEEAADNNIYCTCREKSWGEMIGCDNPDCPMEWFHLKCVNVTPPLPETWFCEACQDKLGLIDSSGTKRPKGRKK